MIHLNIPSFQYSIIPILLTLNTTSLFTFPLAFNWPCPNAALLLALLPAPLLPSSPFPHYSNIPLFQFIIILFFHICP
jgi:hypothetical protein